MPAIISDPTPNDVAPPEGYPDGNRIELSEMPMGRLTGDYAP